MKIPNPKGFAGPFHTELEVRSAYSEGAGPYRIVPDGVAIPLHLEDLLLLVRWAAEQAIPLVPRGAGSGIPGGNVGRGIVVDLQQFDGPLRVSDDKYGSVGAAVTYTDLNRAASELNLRLPTNPASGAFCSLGGMTATNAGGANSLRYGSVRHWVYGVELVTADGEASWLGRKLRSHRQPKPGQQRRLIERLAAEDRFDTQVRERLVANQSLVKQRFPKTTKNSSGYAIDQFLETGDLLDLVIGSEGTLGFVTRVEIGLDPTPAAAGLVVLGVNQLDMLGDVVGVLKTLTPSAIELMDRTLLDMAEAPDLRQAGAEVVLFAEFERSDEALAQKAIDDAIRATSSWTTTIAKGCRAEDRFRLWDLRHAASPHLARLPPTLRSLQIVEDGCVPVESLGCYIQRVREVAVQVGVRVVAFGHAGDGHLHVNALADTTVPDFRDRLATLLQSVTDIIVELGGTISGEHGDGRLRAPLLERTHGAEVTGLFRQIKDAFDPKGILNPGVIVPGGDGNLTANLKVGDGAEEIPDHISSGLLQIEREAGWGMSKLELCTGRVLRRGIR